jgi:serine/threonine kinase 16
MREVEAYRLFAHSDGIIHSVDYSIATERGGGGGIGAAANEDSKTVYVLLPYYRRGNLQDMINANLVNHTRFPERRLLQLFLGVCRALRDMHIYVGRGAERMEVPGGAGGKKGKKTGGAAPKGRAVESGADEEDETEQQRPLMGAEDGESRAAGDASVKSYAHRDIKPGMP